jgi:type 1 fimbriae regulatory protein FimB/type 1 fimbriae regulatory protein FimE
MTKLKRRPNGELRTREYLTEAEVERLITAAKRNRWGHRDGTMILIAYRHGLRASEVVDLRWDQVDLGRNAALHVRRVKQGLPSVHPLQGDEMRALRELSDHQPRHSCSRQSAVRRSRRQVSARWLPGSV